MISQKSPKIPDSRIETDKRVQFSRASSISMSNSWPRIHCQRFPESHVQKKRFQNRKLTKEYSWPRIHCQYFLSCQKIFQNKKSGVQREAASAELVPFLCCRLRSMFSLPKKPSSSHASSGSLLLSQSQQCHKQSLLYFF